MALPNLSGSNIQDTFQRVLHTDGTNFFNGTGSVVKVAVHETNAEFSELIVNDQAQFYSPVIFTDGVIMQGDLIITGSLSAVGTVAATNIVNTSNTTSGLRFHPTSTDVLADLVVSGSLTASGDISASGTITANSLVMDEGGKFYLDGADPQGDPNTYIHNPGGGDKIEFYVDGGGGDGQKLQIGQNGTLFNNNTITIQGEITASGNISASGDLYFNKIDGGTF